MAENPIIGILCGKTGAIKAGSGCLMAGSNLAKRRRYLTRQCQLISMISSEDKRDVRWCGGMMSFINDHSFQFTRIKLLKPVLIVKGLVGRDCAGEK